MAEEKSCNGVTMRDKDMWQRLLIFIPNIYLSSVTDYKFWSTWSRPIITITNQVTNFTAFDEADNPQTPSFQQCQKWSTQLHQPEAEIRNASQCLWNSDERWSLDIITKIDIYSCNNESKCNKFTNQYCLLRNPSLKTTRGLHQQVVSHHVIILQFFLLPYATHSNCRRVNASAKKSEKKLTCGH